MSLALKVSIANFTIATLVVLTISFMAQGTEGSLSDPINERFGYLFNTTEGKIADYSSQTNPNSSYFHESESLASSGYSRFENFLSFGNMIAVSLQIIGLAIAPFAMWGIFLTSSGVMNALMLVFFGIWQAITIMAIVQFLTSGGRE